MFYFRSVLSVFRPFLSVFFCFRFADAGAGGGAVPPVRGLPRQHHLRDVFCSNSPRSVSEDIGHELNLLFQ